MHLLIWLVYCMPDHMQGLSDKTQIRYVWSLSLKGS